MKTKNELLKSVLLDKKECKNVCACLEDGNRAFLLEYSGLFDEKSLLLLVQKAKHSKLYMRLLNAVVICFRKEEISPLVFEELLRISGPFKESIWIGLAHCSLSLFQLYELNKKKVDEALIKLLFAYIDNDYSDDCDLELVLKEWDKDLPKFIIDSVLSYKTDNNAKKEKLIDKLTN